MYGLSEDVRLQAVEEDKRILIEWDDPSRRVVIVVVRVDLLEHH